MVTVALLTETGSEVRLTWRQGFTDTSEDMCHIMLRSRANSSCSKSLEVGDGGTHVLHDPPQARRMDLRTKTGGRATDCT